MTDINQDELLATYDKYQKMKIRMKEANQRYGRTEKGKETKLKIQKKWTESKKDDTEYRLNINRMQRLRYQRKVNQDKQERSLKEECLGIEETEICLVGKST